MIKYQQYQQYEQITMVDSGIIVTVDQRHGAAGGGIAVFNWIQGLLRNILSKVSARRDPDLSSLSQERKSGGDEGAATRYPFYADQLTDTDGPDMRTPHALAP